MKIPSQGLPAGPSGPNPAPAIAVASERAVLDALALRDGQATLARVVERQPATPTSAAKIILEIGGQPIAVETEADLKPGSLLRIQRDGDSLRLLENLGRGSTNALSQALAQKLPAQFDLQAGLKLIAALAKALPGSGASAATPSSSAAPGALGQPSTAQREAVLIRAALSRVLQLMPAQTELARSALTTTQTPGTPHSTSGAASSDSGASGITGRIREWVQASGAFTEARIAQAGANDDGLNDLKSQLLRLAVQLLKTDTTTAAGDLRRLQPAVSPDLVQQALQFPLVPTASQASGRAEPVNAGVLLRIVAGMINRLTVNQLHSQALSSAATPDGSPAPQTWLLELPWLNLQQDPKVIQARIEKHEQKNNDDNPQAESQQAQWRLNLALDLDSLGPVYFEIALTRTSLSTRVWAEHEATWRIAERESTHLRSRLSALGLDIKNLECIHGRPPQTRTRLDQRLVDERA